MPRWYEMRAAAANRPAEILIYDEIGRWGITAQSFMADLAALGDMASLTVRVNSPGGSVFDGIAIHNALVRHPARVTVHVDGVAASIASVIAMGGNEIIIPENAMMMIHDPAGDCSGTAADLRNTADALDRAHAAMVSIYSGRTGLPHDEIAALMAETTWLTAQEALAKGFCTRVDAPVTLTACAWDWSRYRNTPAAVLALATPPAPPPAPPSKSGSSMTEPTPPETPPAPPVQPQPTPQTEADPAAVAEACNAAGFAALTPVLLRAKLPMAAVSSRLTAAAEITQICATGGIPERATEMITAGVSVEAARAAAFTAMAARQAGTPPLDNAPRQPPAGGDKAKPKIPDAKAIYARMNTIGRKV